MTLYCDVDGTLLDSSARHEKLLRDLLAVRGLAWPAAAPDYMRYKSGGHSTKAWLALAGFAPEVCNEIAAAWREGIENRSIWPWTGLTQIRWISCVGCGQADGAVC